MSRDVRAAAAKVFEAIESAQFEDVGFAWLVLDDGETFVVVARVEEGTRNPIPELPEYRGAAGRASTHWLAEPPEPPGPDRDRLLPPVLMPAYPQADDRLLDELRPLSLRDRLPHARQRLRGRGRGAGGAAAGAPGARGRRADRLAARVRRHHHDPAGHQRAAVRPAPAASATSASGCPSRSSPTAHDDPARHAETADSLSLAMLVLLESLSPEQRAALLLHDVFGYGYPEIAAIVGKSEDNVRQLATPRPTARRAAAAPLHDDPRAAATSWRARFFAAVAARRPAPDSRRCWRRTWTLTGDGGGKVPALARTLRGSNLVARTLIAWSHVAGTHTGTLRGAPSRSTAAQGRYCLDGPTAPDRRLGAGCRRQPTDHTHQLGCQPRQAGAPHVGAMTESERGTRLDEASSPGTYGDRPVHHRASHRARGQAPQPPRPIPARTPASTHQRRPSG